MSTIHIEMPVVAKSLGSSQKARKSASKTEKASPHPMGFAAPSAPYKPPTQDEQMKDAAQSAKISAVHQWVRGDISNKKHAAIHRRANKVIATKRPSTARAFGR